MRIVIDIQGAQTASRFRGIGRYTLGLVKGIIRNRGEHEIMLALNGMLSESIDNIRAEFAGLLPKDHIRVWYTPIPLSYEHPDSSGNRAIASSLYSTFIATLKPDVLLVSSMMEGWEDNYYCSISSLRKDVLVASILYDFLPHKNPEKYLTASSHIWYQERFKQLEQIHLGLTISDFTRREAEKYLPGIPVVSISSACNDCFNKLSSTHHTDALLLAMGINRPFVLYAGGLDERKNVPALLAAFSYLPDAVRTCYQIVFPCGGQSLLIDFMKKQALNYGLDDKSVRVLGTVSDDELCSLYNRCSLFVFPSLEEGFGLPVLEAMRCGARVIGSNTTSIPEVIGLNEAMFDPYDIRDITAKLTQALTDESFRERLSSNSAVRHQMFSWDISAQQALYAIEKHAKFNRPKWPSLTAEEKLSNVCSSVRRSVSDSIKISVADCIARTFDDARPQLLIDIGALAQDNARTDTQQIALSLVTQLMATPPQGYAVRPVYALPGKPGYIYAHEFSYATLGYDDGLLEDCTIDWSHRDIFLGLDLQLDTTPQQVPTLNSMKRHGVSIYFVVYDLLTIQFPQYYAESVGIRFRNWLKAIGEFDGIISISQTVMNSVQAWMENNGPNRPYPMQYSWFYPSLDIKSFIPTTGIPGNAHSIFIKLSESPTILMISHIEPIKGHRQALDAFELLWKKGININLVFVDKKSYKIDDIIERINQHPELDKHFFWLQDISKEYLEKIFDISTALLIASENEGFCFAILEGARYRKALILRDIPVFREMAKEHAFYFEGLKPEALASAIETWLQCHAARTYPSSEGINDLTRKESAEMLLSRLPLEHLTGLS